MSGPLTVLVANTKGGCGKTTIATNLAAAFAGAGLITALADGDRQGSSLGWLRRRPETSPTITGLDWGKTDGETPKKIARLVIDAPAAMRLKRAEALIKLADVIVLPVLPSPYDEAATARFLKRIEDLKPIRKSRTAVTVVGNRLRQRTRASARLDAFLDGVGQTVVTRLRDSALYAETAAKGLSLFDLTTRRAADARQDWAPLLRAVEAIV